MSTFFSGVITKVDSIADAFVLAKASAVISSISGVSTTLFVIYVALYGFAMMRGSIEEPVLDAGMRFAKMGLILGLGLTLGNYQQYVYHFLWETPDAMARVLSGTDKTTQVTFIDTIYDTGMSIGDRSWQEMGLTEGLGGNLGYFAIALLSYASAFLLSGYAATLIVLGKISLAVLLAAGPICIMLVMFQGTQKFFESWLGLTLNFVFLSILVAAIVAFMQQLIGESLNAVLAAEDITMRDAGQMLMLGILSVVVLAQAPSMASSLGGGAALTTMGVVGAAARKTANQFQRQPRYEKNQKTGKRDQINYRSNAGIVAAGAGRMAGAPIKLARKLYKASRRNSVANG